MQSIETKYVSPTNTRGAKIKAVSSGGESITIPISYDLDTEQNHAAAAKALKDKLNWKGKMIGGDTKYGYIFVFEESPLKVNPVRKLPKRKTKTLPKKGTVNDWNVGRINYLTKQKPKTPCQRAAKKLRKNPDDGKRYNLIFQKRVISTHNSRALAQATKTSYVKKGYRPQDFTIKVSKPMTKPVTKPIIEKRYHVQARSNVGGGFGWRTVASFPLTAQGKKDATEYANAYYESKNGDVYVQVIS